LKKVFAAKPDIARAIANIPERISCRVIIPPLGWLTFFVSIRLDKAREKKFQNYYPCMVTLVVGHDGGAVQVAENGGIATSGYCTGAMRDRTCDRKEIENNEKPFAGPHALARARPDFKDNGKDCIWS
jgi:hypothetical protein